MEHKYGQFSEGQMHGAKEFIRKRIYFLLLIVDPDTKSNYGEVDVLAAFDGVLTDVSGLNDLLGCPVELVTILSKLNAAKLEYQRDDFHWKKYRKLILDSGNEVMKLKEV
jgi:hypothetical protein